jgi:Tol biopolymer transport system component
MRPVWLLSTTLLFLAACGGRPGVSPAAPATTPAEAAPTAAMSPAPTPTATPGATATTAAPAAAPLLLSGRLLFDDFADIYVAQADGSGAVQLTTAEGPEFDAEWSPDGRRIVYRDSRRGINVDDEIYLMNADGSDQRNVSSHPANDWGPTWSPDGTRIAFNSDRAGGMALVLIDPDGGNAQVVSGEQWIEYPDWSPDGSRFVAMGRPAGSGDYEIYVINADGTEPLRLTDSPGHDGWPVWSPDGRLIAFSSVRDDCRFSDAADCVRTGEDGPHSDIWVMNADGSGLARASRSFGQFLTWTPDGQYIAFGSLDGQLHLVRPDGSAEQRVRLPGYSGDPTLFHWIP